MHCFTNFCPGKCLPLISILCIVHILKASKLVFIALQWCQEYRVSFKSKGRGGNKFLIKFGSNRVGGALRRQASRQWPRIDQYHCDVKASPQIVVQPSAMMAMRQWTTRGRSPAMGWQWGVISVRLQGSSGKSKATEGWSLPPFPILLFTTARWAPSFPPWIK